MRRVRGNPPYRKFVVGIDPLINPQINGVFGEPALQIELKICCLQENKSIWWIMTIQIRMPSIS